MLPTLSKRLEHVCAHLMDHIVRNNVWRRHKSGRRPSPSVMNAIMAFTHRLLSHFTRHSWQGVLRGWQYHGLERASSHLLLPTCCNLHPYFPCKHLALATGTGSTATIIRKASEHAELLHARTIPFFFQTTSHTHAHARTSISAHRSSRTWSNLLKCARNT